jgi:ubiquinone/menaquinone biosynthesis C-methylase UbiE
VVQEHAVKEQSIGGLGDPAKPKKGNNMKGIETPSKVRRNPWSQPVAWVVASLFVAGFFVPAVGNWTGPILAAWFVGTQRPWRGFLWMLAINFVPGLLMHSGSIPFREPVQAMQFLGWMVLGCVAGVLPFTVHRLVSPRLPGGLSTLPLPLAAVVAGALPRPLPIPGSELQAAAFLFLTCWMAAVLVWMWNHDFGAAKIRLLAGLVVPIYAVAAGLFIFRPFPGAELARTALTGPSFAWVCLAGLAALIAFSLFRRREKATLWSLRAETVALLRSPVTSEALHLVTDQGRESLVSPSGESFAIRDGIPRFLRQKDLTGDNGKYNHLYETIGGFYDDTQRVACALRGLDRDSYFRNYMDLLEVKPGDSVLETSVGTGLNFRYLPAGVKLSGLDLSPEMLAACQGNLRRWGLDADLYLGNAESLPFADSSYDVVFHVGGISFFNDKAKAICEMIRVAKPGSLLLIEDETEEYAKSTYERMPIASAYYKNREQAITVPIDLVPAEMEDIHLEMLKDGKFFAITFRKPKLAEKTARNNLFVEERALEPVG